MDSTWDHQSWCPQDRAHCECEFWHRRTQWLWRLYYRINRKRCQHPFPLGKYGSNDYWCTKCGIVIGGLPRAGEVGW